jgi:hypothetical protein
MPITDEKGVAQVAFTETPFKIRSPAQIPAATRMIAERCRRDITGDLYWKPT